MDEQFVITGTFRIYFNRHGAAPLVCCVASDGWELAVKGYVSTAPTVSVYRRKETPDDEDGKPSFWIEVTGVLTVVGGVARISP